MSPTSASRFVPDGQQHDMAERIPGKVPGSFPGQVPRNDPGKVPQVPGNNDEW